jgi:uncharacterized OB-fold protein
VIQAIGTYLPPWGTPTARCTGPDEDVVTMGVAAGRQAMGSSPADAVRAVVLVSRDVPLLEGGNAAPLLAGLGLDGATRVREELGGAPAALAAAVEAPAGTLVIGADLAPAGAAAVVVGAPGADLTLAGRVSRSLPVVTRDAHGQVTDYADPRLARERGVGVSLDRVGLAGKVAAVAGLGRKAAAALTDGDPPVLPTDGASAAIFALAALAERRSGGRILAVEQATVAVADLAGGAGGAGGANGAGGAGMVVARDERAPLPPPSGRAPLPPPSGTATPGPDISISLAAYERAFDVKVRLAAARCGACGTLSLPPRYRCLGCGSEAPTELVDLPRDATVYTVTTVHVPVPSLVTPYSLAIVELGGSGVRLLAHVTGAPPGSVAIGDAGDMVLRRVAVRSGVPDYGYAFLPHERTGVAA